MASEWRQATFADFLALQRGHDLPEQDRAPGSVPILGSFGITGWHNSAKAKAPGMTIGRSGGSFGVATYTDCDYFPLNTTLYVTDFKGNHPRFAYYFAKNFDFTPFNSGSAQPSLNRNFLYPVEVNIPPIKEQKAIAHVLGTLDDKIELNRKTNENLEDIAKALFKSWFVDFDPVRAKAEGRPTGLPDEISELFPDSFEESELGEIPSGWSVAEIGNFLDLERDSVNPSDSGKEIFDHYSIPAYDEGLMPSIEAGQSIKSNKYLVTDGVFMVSKLNPRFPRIWVPSKHTTRRRICSTEFLVCRPKVKVETPFVLHVAKSRSVVQQMGDLASGTSNSHQRVRPADFVGLPFVKPSPALVKLFSEMVQPILEKHLLTRDENQALSKCRDALLPRLISGELRVPDAEKMLEEAGV